ncbi:antirestriction protein ArdC [Parvibaculum indicum]|nr:antirestriction protein ArdC [Parvibaculum indicum]
MINLIFTAEKFQIGAGLSGYIAEINAAFCCASLGIVPSVRHADYIGSWLEVLREDNRVIVRAASQASKAADWLLTFAPAEAEQTVTVEPSCDRRVA